MFSRTSLAFCDFLTMTSLSLTAVCILRTLDWFLEEKRAGRLRGQGRAPDP